MRGNKVNVSDEDLLKDYNETRNVAEVARRHDMIYMTAYTRLFNLGVIEKKKVSDMSRFNNPKYIEYAKTHSIRQIAKYMGVDYRIAKNWLFRNNIDFVRSETNKCKYKEKDAEKRKHILSELLKLYSLQDIADVLGVTKQRISQLLHDEM